MRAPFWILLAGCSSASALGSSSDAGHRAVRDAAHDHAGNPRRDASSPGETLEAATRDARGDGTTRDARDDAASRDAAGETATHDAAGEATTPPLNASNYDGCNIFAANDGVFNTDITNAPVDSDSAAMIASQTNVDASSFAAETYFGTERVNIDEGDSAPKYPVTGNAAYHPAGPTNAALWPWEPSWFIEPGGAGADHHAFVLDTYGKPDNCYIYEAYQMSFTAPSGPLSWNDGNYWDLGVTFETSSQQGYAYSGQGTDVIGTPIFAGGVLLDQVAVGNVMHALNVAVMAHSLSGNPGVFPATETGAGWSYTGTVTAHEMPLGSHIRLHATFDDSSCSPQAQHITYALKHYGGYVSDTGFQGNGLYMFDSNSGTNTWDQAGILACLGSIHFTDFDVLVPPVPGPAIPVNPNP